MQPDELLLDCARLFKERQESHGEFHASLSLIAQFWTVYVQQIDPSIEFSAEDVCHMMALLKIARSLLNPDNQDNYQDAAVYEILAAALSGPPGNPKDAGDR